MELLDPGDGRVLEPVRFPVLHQRDVGLAGAEDDTLDLLGGGDFAGLVGRVGDDPLEVRLARELADWRPGERVAEEGLGEEEDEGW